MNFLDSRYPKDRYLQFMCVIYLIAFSSLYVQCSGLYGDKGILPVNLLRLKVPTSFGDFFKEPNLLRLVPLLGLDTDLGVQFFCLLGIAVSFLASVLPLARSMLTFAAMWALYFSLYQVGQVFMSFQWDILLLEAGFLSILLAPSMIGLPGVCQSPTHAVHDRLSLWMVRWLLFRLMFASGVVKLTSGCPTWWNLTALMWHYASQCIPTPFAWYFHQLPDWFQRFSVVATFVIEIAIPLLFFVRIRSVRLFAYYSQLLLQLLIILTGNYNFFNLLTIVLCYSLLSDEDFEEGAETDSTSRSSFDRLISWLICVGLAMVTMRLFDLRVSNWSLQSRIMFSKADFNKFLETVVPSTVILATFLFMFEMVTVLTLSLRAPGKLRKVWELMGTIVVGVAAFSIFMQSLVPLAQLDKGTRDRLPASVRTLFQKFRQFELVNSYGLFRRMTGVGGRPEVIIEGSLSGEDSWAEYQFPYKPGRLDRPPPLVAPHQPRLDWQMWFAALSSYEDNPWFIHLVYRLLVNQKEVLQLLSHNPFPKDPPKYIRAILYTYNYTQSGDSSNSHFWWKRQFKKIYLQPLSLDEVEFRRILERVGILGKQAKKPPLSFLASGIRTVRDLVGQPEGFRFVMSLLLVQFLITMVHQRMGG